MIIKSLQKRYSVKKFDGKTVLSDEQIFQLLEAVRLSPSSVNSQPWKVFVIHNQRQAFADVVMQENHAYNHSKVVQSSHSFVLAGRIDTHDFVHSLTEQMVTDERFQREDEGLKLYEELVSVYSKMHQKQGTLPSWFAKQVYIALGVLLTTAAVLKIDACPIEGFDKKAADKFLKLKHYHSQVCVAFGKADKEDFNQLDKLKKSRLDLKTIARFL